MTVAVAVTVTVPVTVPARPTDPGGGGYDGGMPTITLAEFNTAPASVIVPELESILGSAPLADSVAAARPFRDVADLVAATSRLLDALSTEEVRDAVNAHPPIGGSVARGSRSADEQAGATESADLDVVRDLQPVYREKFGWNFLIRAAGRSSGQIRAELERRMSVGPDEEWAFSVDQLRAINELRLRGYVTDDTDDTDR